MKVNVKPLIISVVAVGCAFITTLLLIAYVNSPKTNNTTSVQSSKEDTNFTVIDEQYDGDRIVSKTLRNRSTGAIFVYNYIWKPGPWDYDYYIESTEVTTYDAFGNNTTINTHSEGENND